VLGLLQATFALFMFGRLAQTGQPGTVVDEPDQVMQARQRATRAKARELAAHRHAEDLHEEAAQTQRALGTVIVLKRLGSERSTLDSSMPKPSGSKPKRTSGHLLGRPVGLQQGERFLMRH
jgi:sRNA-binding protein